MLNISLHKENCTSHAKVCNSCPSTKYSPPVGRGQQCLYAACVMLHIKKNINQTTINVQSTPFYLEPMTTPISQARRNWSICYLAWKVTASQLCLHLTGNLACLHYPKSFNSVASYTDTVLISTIFSEAFSCNVLILTRDVCFVLNGMSGFVNVVCWQWVWKQSVTYIS